MHIAIIGNGISGVTAARFLRKLSGHDITLISAETPHFFSRTALMYRYMGHLTDTDLKPYEDWFWTRNRIQLLQDYVERIDTTSQHLHLRASAPLHYDKLIIASGSRPNFFGWPGQDLTGVSGLYSWQDLQYIEQHSEGLQHAVIVGGGLIGIELAEMFRSRDIGVTLLVRESSYWNNVLPPEESRIVNRHILEHHIDLRLDTELQAILPDKQGRVRAVTTAEGEEIACGFVGITAGVSPNINFLDGSGIQTNRGILVDEYLRTNVPNVYAIGDCAELRDPQPSRRPIEAIWYTGKMMGETVAYNIIGQTNGQTVPYVPRLWFNSAKFLDIEYQVYGDVPTAPDPTLTSLYWEHPSGRKSIRIVYERDTLAVRGFNLMGIRYRHEVCEKWIKQRASIEDVLAQLSLANFDPEFFEAYEPALLQAYAECSGRQITSSGSRKPSAALAFVGKRRARWDTAQEDQPLRWYRSRKQLRLLAAMFTLFAGVAYGYYYFKLIGLLYVAPLLALALYGLIRTLNRSTAIRQSS